MKCTEFIRFGVVVLVVFFLVLIVNAVGLRLEDYPGQFNKDGFLDDTFLIVGEDVGTEVEVFKDVFGEVRIFYK